MCLAIAECPNCSGNPEVAHSHPVHAQTRNVITRNGVTRFFVGEGRYYREDEAIWVDCPGCGTQPPKTEPIPYGFPKPGQARISFVTRAPFYTARELALYATSRYPNPVKLGCGSCGKVAPVRYISLRFDRASTDERCNGACLNGRKSCNCRCGGRCHGAGSCSCA